MDDQLVVVQTPMFQQLCKVQHVESSQIAVRERVWCCCWHYSGKLLATAGEDRTIKIWRYTENDNPDDANKLELAACLRGDQNRSIRCVQFSPCGRFLVAASFDATVLIYQHHKLSDEWEELHRLEGHENEVKGCSFSISGRFLATCSRDKSVWIWQAEEEDGDDYEVLSILQQHTADVKFVVWHPREDILLSGGYDCSLRFYTFDGEDWTTAQAIPNAHDETIWSAAFEPTTGQCLATVGGDRCIKIWTRAKQQQLEDSWHSWHKSVDLSLEEETRWPLYTVAWSRSAPDGLLGGNDEHMGILAVGGGDRMIRLFLFDAKNEVLIRLDKIRMDAEINSLSWRPSPSKPEKLLQNGLAEHDEEEPVENGFENPERRQQSPMVLAAALDDGFLHLLQVGR